MEKRHPPQRTTEGRQEGHLPRKAGKGEGYFHRGRDGEKKVWEPGKAWKEKERIPVSLPKRGVKGWNPPLKKTPLP